MRRTRIVLVLAAGVGFSAALAGCDSSRLFEDNKTIPDDTWNVNNIVSFDVDVKDTATPNNFYINVRNASCYPNSNLYLFITTKFPNGKMSRDTVECQLADETGKWLGDGSGDIWDNRILFKKKTRFPMTGRYTFFYQHAMWLENMPCLMEIGMRIEKAEK